MIKVKKGNAFYRMECEHSENFGKELLEFLATNDVKARELQKINFNLKDRVGSKFQVKKENEFVLDINIQEDIVVLLFETEMTTNQFYDLIRTNFQ